MTLATRELGRADGPALVLFHGNGDSSACWPDAARRWAQAYRVVAVDARGHGASPLFSPSQLAEPGDVFVSDALELLRDCAPGDPVVAVGHSLGSGTLTGVLAQAPGLLRGAVLIDPPWDSPVVLGGRPDVGAARVAFVESVQRDPDAALRRHVEENPAWPADEHEPWVASKLSLDLAYIATGAGRPSTPWPELVAGIAEQTLVVTGDRDCLVGTETRSELERIGNPAVDVAVLEGTDHYVRQGDAAAFHAMVDPWMEEVFGLTPAG
jgi:pimeloyl-ACP methyl ester carboxylesterase